MTSLLHLSGILLFLAFIFGLMAAVAQETWKNPRHFRVRPLSTFFIYASCVCTFAAILVAICMISLIPNP